METAEQYKARMIAELEHEIKGCEMYLERSKPSTTIESGSGSWRRRKNKQYSKIHSMQVSMMEDRLIGFRNRLEKIKNS